MDTKVNSRPLITVVITNYNYGQYIAKAIKSVLAQTYSNIELIIIDDGSTDDSNEIIDELIRNNPGRNIRHISRENRGVVYTRNQGMELAKGEYISYLDADDYFNRNYISKSYKIAKQYNADVVYPNWHFVGDWLGRPDTNFPEFTPELLQLQELHCTPASIIRKQAVGNHKFEVEKVAEDWDFFIGLSLDGAKFKLAKDNCINYRIRQGTRGSKNDPREDTRYFVEILTKYKKIHGDRVIDPKSLVKLRHPNIVTRVFNMRYPRVVMESIKKDGASVTARKVVRKSLSKNIIFWKTLRYMRNKEYQKITKSLSISKSPNTRLAVVVHLYYPDLWPAIKEKLGAINIPFDLFVSVKVHDKDITLGKVSKHHKTTNITALPNRGRDVLPFVLIANQIAEAGQYRYVLKLHSKKSLHRNDGEEWLESLLSQLIPSDISGIIEVLEKTNTGVVGPGDHVVSLSKYIGANKERIGTILGSITDKQTAERITSTLSKYPYFGGTMFWCRVDFLIPILKSKATSPADFDTERGQVDGTCAHAIERILGRALHEVSNKKMYVIKGGVVSELPNKRYMSKYKHVG